jgi:hypothetical protein
MAIRNGRLVQSVHSTALIAGVHFADSLLIVHSVSGDKNKDYWG